jgi:hypothetical protein
MPRLKATEPEATEPEERPLFDFYRHDNETWVVAFYPANAGGAAREVCVVSAFGEEPDPASPTWAQDRLARNWRTPEEAEHDACEIASALNAGLMLGRLVR